MQNDILFLARCCLWFIRATVMLEYTVKTLEKSVFTFPIDLMISLEWDWVSVMEMDARMTTEMA